MSDPCTNSATPTADPSSDTGAIALLRWDVFCRVIDNYGDLGVCWRLCADLAERGHSVRLWADDASHLEWMAPGALQGQWPGIEVLPWSRSQDTAFVKSLRVADVWIEAFGCEIATKFIADSASAIWPAARNGTFFPIWINLEYLSAEGYVERAHGLASPVQHGPAAGHSKYFFYPGFTALTGSVLRGTQFKSNLANDRAQCLAPWGIYLADSRPDSQWVSMFCYEPPLLAALLAHWAARPQRTHLLVAAGRAAQAVRAALATLPTPLDATTAALQVSYLPFLAQAAFDAVLACCDVNFVRGEDSLVRAIWAGKPLVWHIYPQADGAHLAKLQAFLETLQAPPAMVKFHQLWNAATPESPGANAITQLYDLAPAWEQAVQQLRSRLLAMDDLTTQLIQFVHKKR